MADSELVRIAQQGGETVLGVVWYGHVDTVLAATDDPNLFRTPRGNVVSDVKKKEIYADNNFSVKLSILDGLLRRNT